VQGDWKVGRSDGAADRPGKRRVGFPSGASAISPAQSGRPRTVASEEQWRRSGTPPADATPNAALNATTHSGKEFRQDSPM